MQLDTERFENYNSPTPQKSKISIVFIYFPRH